MFTPANDDSLDILENLDIAYFETDLGGVVRRANRSLARRLGWHLDEVIGQHWRQIFAAENRFALEQAFGRAAYDGETHKGIPLQIAGPRSQGWSATASLASFNDREGMRGGFRVIIHDGLPLGEDQAPLHPAKWTPESELEIARRIQASFLPKALPQPEGWEIASQFQAARMVSGDFYDAFPLANGRRIGLVIADVCDKGLGSALFMALFRSLIRAFADQHYSLGWMDILNHTETSGEGLKQRREMLSAGTTTLRKTVELTNQYILKNHGDTSMFATLFIGLLDPSTGNLMYINAGQEPPVLVNQGQVKAYLEPTGPVVGLMPGLEFGIGQVELAPEDILVASTDGAFDVRNPAGEAFGEARLLSLLEEPAPSATVLLERIKDRLDEYIAGGEQFDDITLLGLHRRPLSTE